MEYILKVTEDGIIIPQNIPNGTYKLVFEEEISMDLKDLIRSNFVYFEDANGRRAGLYTHALKKLISMGITSLTELEGKSSDMFNTALGVGKNTIAIIAVLCTEFNINFQYYLKYEEDVIIWKKRFIRK